MPAVISFSSVIQDHRFQRFIFKITIPVARVHFHIRVLDFLDHPFMNDFLSALGRHNILHCLEVLRYRCPMLVNAALELYNGANSLTLCIHHLEWFRHLIYFQVLNHTCYFCRKRPSLRNATYGHWLTS